MPRLTAERPAPVQRYQIAAAQSSMGETQAWVVDTMSGDTWYVTLQKQWQYCGKAEK